MSTTQVLVRRSRRRRRVSPEGVVRFLRVVGRGQTYRNLLYLLLAHTVVGQLLLGLAMQRGSTTAAVAAMDAAAAVPAAIVGLLFLGDEVRPGREWLVAFGFVFTLGGVIGLSFYAEPQHHHAVVRSRLVARRPQLGASTMPKAPFASSMSNSPAGTARAKWKP